MRCLRRRNAGRSVASDGLARAGKGRATSTALPPAHHPPQFRPDPSLRSPTFPASTDPSDHTRSRPSHRPPNTPLQTAPIHQPPTGPHTCTEVAAALQSGILPTVRDPDFGRDNDRIYRPQDRAQDGPRAG